MPAEPLRLVLAIAILASGCTHEERGRIRPVRVARERVCDGELIELPAAAGGRAFCLYDDAKTFADAEARCVATGTHLATIESAEENRALSDALRSPVGSEPYWIGLREASKDRWQWASGATPRFGAWAKGEPNDQGGDEDCVVLLGGAATWNDLRCDLKRGYVCERTRNDFACTGLPVHTGHGDYCFYAATLLTWQEAANACAANGGELAELETEVESDALKKALSPRVERVWIGLDDAVVEGDFRWTSGRPRTFTSFAKGEPNDQNGSEDCVELLPDRAGWNDLPCGLALPSLCGE